MKLSPNVTDIAEIARACADAGGPTGICLINTPAGDADRPEDPRGPCWPTGPGASAPRRVPVALRMVWDVYEAVKLPIIGCGGVSSAEDVCEMMLAGGQRRGDRRRQPAGPPRLPQIIQALPAVCQRLGAARAADLTGAAHRP